MGYTSNYLGQLEEVRYPDGERVTYEYNAGGQVQKVSGRYEDPGYRDIVFPYVDDIGYDEFGQRVYMSYGNGVATKYTYDEQRRWLAAVVSTAQNGEVIQNISKSSCKTSVFATATVKEAVLQGFSLKNRKACAKPTGFCTRRYDLDYVGNVAGYTNKSAAYETDQSYTYDSLYQLNKSRRICVFLAELHKFCCF